MEKKRLKKVEDLNELQIPLPVDVHCLDVGAVDRKASMAVAAMMSFFSSEKWISFKTTRKSTKCLIRCFWILLVCF